MSSDQIVKEAWNSIVPNQSVRDVHRASGAIANHLIRECMHRRALDNLTVIVIGLQNLADTFASTELRDSRVLSQPRKQLT